MAAGALVAHRPGATAIKPAIVFSNGGKFDKSFNEGVSMGAERSRRVGDRRRRFEPTSRTQFEQALRRFAQRGQDQSSPSASPRRWRWRRSPREFPNRRFTIIDASSTCRTSVDRVQEQEGSFLVGVLAAMASKSGKVGFVGGMDIPLIRRFQCGYEQGISGPIPKVELIANMTGTTPAAWNDPGRGAGSPRVSSTAASTSSMPPPARPASASCRPPRIAAKLAIGVDSNQNHLHPGSIP